jgi:RNA polymerase sigma-54 factor
MKPRLDLRLSQKLIMTPQLQQAIKLLQLSKLELTQVVSQQLLENPLLEEIPQEQSDLEESAEEGPESKKENDGDSDDQKDTEAEELKSQWDEYLQEDYEGSKNVNLKEADTDDTPSYEQTLTKPTTLAEHIVSQLQLAKTTPQLFEIGLVIIGNIDEDGYLRTLVEDVAQSLGVSIESVEAALSLVQSFDPAGIGARNLQECLLIQVKELDIKMPFIKQIIRDHLKDVENKNYKAISKSIKASLDEVVTAVKIIEGLEPKPGRPFYLDEAQTIIPDVYVGKSEGGYQLIMNDDGLPRLQISPFYRKLLASRADASSSTRQYLNEHLKSAIWLIRSIEQRNKTIFKVAQSIVKLQQDFFDRGIAYLKPLVLRQVAEDIGMHESTISRVTTNKYMHTPNGIFEFKFFFNNSVSLSNGCEGELSSITVREMIRQIVEGEGSKRPLRDQEIVNILMDKNINIARRTVAKYRSELKIPSASRRKKYT